MIDSHCHLDHDTLIDNLEEIISRSKAAGINKILTICTTYKSYKNILKIIKKDPIIFGTFGIHPHEADKDKINCEKIIEEISKEEKVIGVGETGLDFYYNNSDKIDQIKSLEEHIKAAVKLKIPLIIHSRNAEKETLEIFDKYKKEKLKILMHCFTGSKEFAQKLLDFNTYFSASGIITFKNSQDLQETFKIIPLNRLLIETDSPFLAPEPKRGKKNEPSFVKYTAEKLAFIKNISNKELIKTTSNNFNNLFG